MPSRVRNDARFGLGQPKIIGRAAARDTRDAKRPSRADAGRSREDDGGIEAVVSENVR